MSVPNSASLAPGELDAVDNQFPAASVLPERLEHDEACCIESSQEDLDGARLVAEIEEVSSLGAAR